MAKTLSNNFGLSLLAQPAAFTWAVNFLSWVKSSMLPHYNNGMRRTAVSSVVLLLALGFTLVAVGSDSTMLVAGARAAAVAARKP